MQQSQEFEILTVINILFLQENMTCKFIANFHSNLQIYPIFESTTGLQHDFHNTHYSKTSEPKYCLNLHRCVGKAFYRPCADSTSRWVSTRLFPASELRTYTAFLAQDISSMSKERQCSFSLKIFLFYAMLLVVW